MSFDPARSIRMFFNRAAIENVIFKAELMVAASKIDPSIVIGKYADKYAKSKPFASGELKSIARRLKANHPKQKVYAEYVDRTILSLLEIADQKGLPTSTILEEYAPIRKIALNNQGRIKSALTMPLVLFVLIVLVLGVIADQLGTARTAIEFSPVSLFFMDNFTLFNAVLFVALIVGFFIYPRKIPVLSTVYRKLDSLLAVALVETMHVAGLSSSQIIPVVRHQFSIPYKKGNGELEQLVAILGESRLLNTEDMADMELAMSYGQFNQTLTEIKEQKVEEAKQFSDVVGDVVKNFSLLVMAAPIFQYVIIILDLVTKSTSMVSQ